MRSRYKPCPRCRSQGKDTAGDNLVLYPDGGGHCFSCGYHEHGAKVPFILKEQKPNVPKSMLPADFTREVPTTALKWLLQYGLPFSYWKDQIGYSASENRLIFLVGQPVQFSIGRYCGPPDDKVRKWYVWGDPHRHCEVVGAGGTVVLVEDLISAHKIANCLAGVESIPLFGVEFHPPHLYYLMQGNKRVVLWLDKDQRGSITRKAARLQSLLGTQVDCVTTDKDPKSLSCEEINGCI